jgi:superfamily II DNA or RNA helicase
VLEVYRHQPHGGSALLVIPTGGGKTVIFAEIARRLGLTTLILAHREELLTQAADKFRLIDPTAIIGQVGAGRHEWGAPVTVASVQTVSRPEHLKTLRRLQHQLVICDESHHAIAAGYRAVLDALPDAFVVAVTATPDRLDGQNIETLFGAPVFSASIVEMVAQGYLCDLRAIAVKTATSLDGLHTQAGDFKTDELEEMIDTQERNERVVRAYLEHARGRQALCFAVTVKHAQHLAETFARFEVRASMVCGNTPTEERRRRLFAYERGALTVLCNVGVLTEGFDHPATSCVILARPTQSRALFTQMVGRGTRLAPGKGDCIILDVTDNCLKLRLQPVTLGAALGKEIRDGESLIEATVREKEPVPGREQQQRRARVTKRAQDLHLNLLASMDWKRRANGVYWLEVGKQKHRITLVPSEEIEGTYTVKAALAPTYAWQTWLANAPLSWAQQHAEAKARLLESGSNKRILVDSTASWRQNPVSFMQLRTLRNLGIQHEASITSGEASDLIGQAIAEQNRAKAEKELAKLQQGEVTTKRKGSKR